MHSSFRNVLPLAIAALFFHYPAVRADDKPAKEEFRYDGKTFDYWDTYLRTELKSERRIEAVRALAAFGAKGQMHKVVSTIVELVKEYNEETIDYYGTADNATPDQKVIQEAIAAISKMGVPAFDDLLFNAKDPRVRSFVMASFIGTPSYKGIRPSAPGVQTLIQTVSSDDPKIRHFAVDILGRVLLEDKSAQRAVVTAVKGMEGDKIVRGLVRTVCENERSSSGGANTILTAIGPAARSGIPGLLQGLSGEDEDRKYWVIDALGLIAAAPEQTIPALAQVLKNGNESVRVRCMAAISLGRFGLQGGAAASGPLLCELADDEEDLTLRAAVIAALQESHSDPAKVVPHLVRGLETELQPGRVGSAGAVHFVINTVRYLEDVGPKAVAAVPVLVNLLGHINYSDKLYSLSAIKALGEIGADAKPALPQLRRMLMSNDEEVRQAASAAIKKVTKQQKPEIKSGSTE